jgi:hypothetical protein
VRDVKLQFRRIKINATTQKAHYLQKALITRKQIDDALDSRFRSFLTIFVPKLTSRHTTPRIMLHLSNGNSSTMCRMKSPDEMIKLLEDCIATLRSDKWMDTWWRLTDISENLINNNQLELNHELIDVEEWKKDIINNSVNDGLEIVEKKKDALDKSSVSKL